MKTVLLVVGSVAGFVVACGVLLLLAGASPAMALGTDAGATFTRVEPCLAAGNKGCRRPEAGCAPAACAPAPALSIPDRPARPVGDKFGRGKLFTDADGHCWLLTDDGTMIRADYPGQETRLGAFPALKPAWETPGCCRRPEGVGEGPGCGPITTYGGPSYAS
jgi:hypothetical protein